MAFSDGRVGFMLADARVPVIVTVSAWRQRLSGTAARLVVLDEEREQIAACPAGDPGGQGAPGGVAYVIYTSGSTGVPKGVMVEQRGMVNHLAAKVSDLGLTPADTVAATASPCFDISVWQFLAALVVGGRVDVVSGEMVRDPALLLAAVAARRVSVAEMVPSLLRAVLDEVARLGAARPRLAALRWLVLTGEALPPGLCRAWLGWYPRVAVVNAYGPTECSDDVTHQVIAAAPDAGGGACSGRAAGGEHPAVRAR